MRWTSKPSAENYHRLDIRELRKHGYLRPGSFFRLRWTRGGDETGSIQGHSTHDSVVLSYRHKSHGSDDWKSENYPVYLDRTLCNYGGKRVWFQCPAVGCGRRVAVLYGGGIFACRHCHRLAYESQREQPHGRALRRTQAIRMKLGGSSSMADDFPQKPKGMHWQTYWRYVQKVEDANARSIPPWVLKIFLPT
jgi:hypothetical protein